MDIGYTCGSRNTQNEPSNGPLRAHGRKTRTTSHTLSRYVVVICVPIVLQSFYHLLHLVVPIGPHDNHTANTAGERQSDSEADPETPEFHVMLEGEVDAQRDTNDIIRAGDEKALGISVWERGFSGDLHKVKEGASCLPTLSTKNAGRNSSQSIHDLE